MSGTQKNVSDFVQKHSVSATNVSQLAQPKKHHWQQCVPNNVSATMCPRLPGPLAVHTCIKQLIFCRVIKQWCFLVHRKISQEHQRSSL